MQLDEILTFVSEPMETDVKHNILAQDRYAKALYQFDKAGSITEEEKQAYIAICKMLYQIDKSNGAVIGSMVKQEKAMTFEHFLSDIQSRKQTNKNVVIDDDFGLVIEVDRSNTVAQQIQNYYQQLLDQTLLQDEIEYLNELQLKEEYDMIKEGFTISDETINQFLQADFTPSIWEMVTYDSFLQKKSTIYQELISNTSNESSIKNLK